MQAQWDTSLWCKVTGPSSRYTATTPHRRDPRAGCVMLSACSSAKFKRLAQITLAKPTNSTVRALTTSTGSQIWGAYLQWRSWTYSCCHWNCRGKPRYSSSSGIAHLALTSLIWTRGRKNISSLLFFMSNSYPIMKKSKVLSQRSRIWPS